MSALALARRLPDVDIAVGGVESWKEQEPLLVDHFTSVLHHVVAHNISLVKQELPSSCRLPATGVHALRILHH